MDAARVNGTPDPIEGAASVTDAEIDLLAEQAAASTRLQLQQRRAMARLLLAQRSAADAEKKGGDDVR